jgi:hypothetical protein
VWDGSQTLLQSILVLVQGAKVGKFFNNAEAFFDDCPFRLEHAWSVRNLNRPHLEGTAIVEINRFHMHGISRAGWGGLR